MPAKYPRSDKRNRTARRKRIINHGAFAHLDNLADAAAFTTLGAARITSVGHSTLLNLIHSGQLKSFKIGRRRLVRRSDLDAFIASRVAK